MPQHLSINYTPVTENMRIEAALTKEILAPADEVFPLACPVEERRWIPQWDYHLVYSQSGVNETNCIFREDLSGLHFFDQHLTTTWVTSLHDPVNRQILFHLDISGKGFIRLDIRFQPVGKKASRGSWHMVFTAIDDEANAMSADAVRMKLELVLTFLAEALKHYCETGAMVA